MRIVQLVGWYYPDSAGGTEAYVAGLSKRLAKRGHDVTIAAPHTASRSERTYEHDGLRVYRYPIPSAPTRAEAQGLIGVRGSQRLATWIEGLRPDVVHAHTFVTGLGLRELTAAKWAGARVVATSHSGSLGWICQRGTMMRWGTRPCDGVCRSTKCAACSLQHRGVPKAMACVLGATPALVGRVMRRVPGKIGTLLSMRDLIDRNVVMQRAMLDTVDKFVVLTQWGFDAVLANGGEPGKVVLNRLGQNWSTARRKPDPEQRPTMPPVTVGYLGRFDPIKGVDDLARAVRSLPATVPVRAEFRGPVRTEHDREILRQLRLVAGADPRIHVAAEVPPGEVPAVLSGYDVLCCPAVCLEGGPTVALEAHAVGTPVIGTRIGGLAELVTDGINGRLVSPGNWRELARVINDIAMNPRDTLDRWRTHLPPARTMDDVTDDYLKLYATLC